MIRSALRPWLVAVSFVLLVPSTGSASSILIDIDHLDGFTVPLSDFGVFVSVEIDALPASRMWRSPPGLSRF